MMGLGLPFSLGFPKRCTLWNFTHLAMDISSSSSKKSLSMASVVSQLPCLQRTLFLQFRRKRDFLSSDTLLDLLISSLDFEVLLRFCSLFSLQLSHIFELLLHEVNAVFHLSRFLLYSFYFQIQTVDFFLNLSLISSTFCSISSSLASFLRIKSSFSPISCAMFNAESTIPPLLLGCPGQLLPLHVLERVSLNLYYCPF